MLIPSGPSYRYAGDMYLLLLLYTHLRSIAERDGCFQQRLFVCLSAL